MKNRPDDREPNLIGIALLSIIAISIAWHLSVVAVLVVVVAVAWAFARVLTAQWWRARARAFGRELERRAIGDLQRIASLLRTPVRPNVAVPGLGDADALLGHGPTLVEIKAFRSWDSADPRCQSAIAQVERLKQRLGLREALIWLPQGNLTLMQRLGFVPGLPSGTRLVTGPAWRPVLKTHSFFGRSTTTTGMDVHP